MVFSPFTILAALFGLHTTCFMAMMFGFLQNSTGWVDRDPANRNVTRTGLLQLTHSLLDYVVDMTDIYRSGWPITRKHRHMEMHLNKNVFPGKIAKQTVPLFTI